MHFSGFLQLDGKNEDTNKDDDEEPDFFVQAHEIS
jgi:hypothetical protein